jgi:hypothetical protein
MGDKADSSAPPQNHTQYCIDSALNQPKGCHDEHDDKFLLSDPFLSFVHFSGEMVIFSGMFIGLSSSGMLVLDEIILHRSEQTDEGEF